MIDLKGRLEKVVIQNLSSGNCYGGYLARLGKEYKVLVTQNPDVTPYNEVLVRFNLRQKKDLRDIQGIGNFITNYVPSNFPEEGLAPKSYVLYIDWKGNSPNTLNELNQLVSLGEMGHVTHIGRNGNMKLIYPETKYNHFAIIDKHFKEPEHIFDYLPREHKNSRVLIGTNTKSFKEVLNAIRKKGIHTIKMQIPKW
ncbi:MAG: hypothetical protein U9Q06_00080 [Nanoarchaeota archaeon]|nr:hypothetical protein [Nanoarchaeota archaeon]